MFEILEHTADIGFRVRAASLPELFEAAAQALASIAIETANIEPRGTFPIEARGADNQELLVNWLNEVLWLLDGKRIALGRFEVAEVGEGRVAGMAWGEPLDPARHRAKIVVKGVTYHQLEVVRENGGWRARVFLDI
jgi:SHS2 domain-containing protein